MSHRLRSRLVQRAVPLAALAVFAAMLGGPPAHAASGPYRHASGLRVVPKVQPVPVPPALADTYDALDALSETQPDAYGYVRLDTTGTRLTLPVASAAAAGTVTALAKGTLSTGRLKPTAADPYGKLQARLSGVKPRGIKSAAITTTSISARSLASAQAPASAGTSAAPPQTTASRAALDSIKDSVIELSRDPQFADADIWQSEVDRGKGYVVVSAAHLTDALAAKLVADYGTDLIAVTEQPNPLAKTQNGRLSDKTPYRGGNRLYAPDYGACTGGFSWRITASLPGMLTAGHCAPYGGAMKADVAIGGIASMTRENWTPGIGTTFLSGQSTYRGDMALIQLYSGKSSAPSIYRGAANGTSTSTVTEMWHRRAQPGDQYCVGGSMAGEICGWTVSKVGVNQKLGDGSWERNIVLSSGKQGWCSQEGDSGGPVFTVTPKNTIAAKGLTVVTWGGGSDHYGGPLDSCGEGFTDIWDAYVGFPGNLAT